jgi:hypothetical protein
LYIEVLREIYETEGLRGVTFASESLVKLVAVTVQECQRTGQKEHMTTGVVAARICAEWAPKILKGIELSKAT